MKVIKINPDKPDQKLLQQAAAIILNDGVIAYPTETVYGLGANALSNVAVEKVYQLKQREKNKPILVIASNLEQVMELVKIFPDVARALVRHFWPGPLTIVFKAAPYLAKPLLGNGNSIGIRIPDNRICSELLKLCGVPLTSTSANLTGGKNSVNVEEVLSSFRNKLDFMIDGGCTCSRVSSTVLDLTREKPVLLREGVINKNAIENLIGFNINEINKE